MDRGAWPFVDGGVICVVTSVSVCTKREKEGETRERRNKKEHSRVIAG